MFRLLLSTLICALPVVSGILAQDLPNLVSPTKVTSIGYWNNGQSARYHVKQQESSFKGKSEKPFKDTQSEYDIKLKVIDSTATSYDFEMYYTSYTPDEDADEFVKRIAELAFDIPIIYRTNELGQFDTILNLEELQKDLLEKLEESKSIFADSKEVEATEIYIKIMDLMKLQFSDLENVEALFLSDIIMLHGYYGFEMQSGKPLDIELYYATIGDYVMTGTGKLTLSTINKGKDECIINATEKPNRDELKEYMESLALLFMLDSGKKFSMEELNITMNTKRKMKMELSTGWMNSVVNTSTTKLTNKKGEQRKVVVHEYVRQ